MKIIIFGADGMLGTYLNNYLSKFYKVIALTRINYDINNLTIASLDNLFNNYNIKPSDVIINSAGIIPQCKNNNISLYYLINSIFPILLKHLSDKYKTKMIHITTDCVFSGMIGNYNENDKKDEINDYGSSKTLGELCNCCIIRTSIIGEQIKNKYSLLEWVKSHNNQNLKGFANHFWNGVTCLQLAKIINKIINENLFWNGVRHIYSPNIVSKYELVHLINNTYKLNNNIEKYNTENTINKTLKTIYNTNSLFDIPDLKVQIEELYNYKLI